ncbi:MAG TPA: hypothetical protein VK469_00935 [Candidatus Kapabacteria bacterium]|nr:hypothetical protein [Candidatus Kapabacteria bacterium]
MKEKFSTSLLWKYIGDEVLFYKTLDSRTQLFETIPRTFEVLTSSLKHLSNSFPDIFKPLSIKGTIWSAKVVNVNGEEFENLNMNQARNIALAVSYENYVLKDFIGPDIDTGFRISRHAGKGKLVISADFASLLLEAEAPNGVKKDDLVKNLKIVSYEDLKGIWKDRYYPIIWYFKDWEKRNEEFDYDDRFRSKIINNICLEQTHDICELTKIFRQLGNLKNIDNLLALLMESEKNFENKRIESLDNQLIPVEDLYDV